jgi:hypothetical protein
MMIMVAGPYSAQSVAQRRANLLRLQQAALAVRERGHIPVIGENLGLPMVIDLAEPLAESPTPSRAKEWIQQLSLDLAARCDAVLLLSSSPGADREVQAVLDHGGRLFYAVEEIPPVVGDEESG